MNNSNEKEIREAFRSFLATHYKGIIVDEFSGGGMRRRPDLTCITDEHIIMVEIKSDKDTFARLEQQILDYKKYSSRIFVVVDISHHEKLIKFRDGNTAAYSADFVMYDKGSFLCSYDLEKYELRDKRPTPFSLDLVGLLWAEERRNLLRPFLGFYSLGNCRDYEALYSIYTTNELIQLTFETIRNRWEYISKQDKRFCKGYKGGTYKSAIKHIEYKQLMFNDFLTSIGKKIKQEDELKPSLLSYEG